MLRVYLKKGNDWYKSNWGFYPFWWRICIVEEDDAGCLIREICEEVAYSEFSSHDAKMKAKARVKDFKEALREEGLHEIKPETVENAAF